MRYEPPKLSIFATQFRRTRHMMSIRTHEYHHSLYAICGVESVTQSVGRSVPVCVPMRA